MTPETFPRIILVYHVSLEQLVTDKVLTPLTAPRRLGHAPGCCFFCWSYGEFLILSQEPQLSFRQSPPGLMYEGSPKYSQLLQFMLLWFPQSKFESGVVNWFEFFVISPVGTGFSVAVGVKSIVDCVLSFPLCFFWSCWSSILFLHSLFVFWTWNKEVSKRCAHQTGIVDNNNLLCLFELSPPCVFSFFDFWYLPFLTIIKIS
jgi:hypothetical protein